MNGIFIYSDPTARKQGKKNKKIIDIYVIIIIYMSWFFLSLTSRVMLSSERGAETFKPSRDAEKAKRPQKERMLKKNNPYTSFVEFPTVYFVDNINISSVLGFSFFPG